MGRPFGKAAQVGTEIGVRLRGREREEKKEKERERGREKADREHREADGAEAHIRV